MHDLALFGRAVAQKYGEGQHGPSAFGHERKLAIADIPP
jgi:hypothetical protein